MKSGSVLIIITNPQANDFDIAYWENKDTYNFAKWMSTSYLSYGLNYLNLTQYSYYVPIKPFPQKHKKEIKCIYQQKADETKNRRSC